MTKNHRKPYWIDRNNPAEVAVRTSSRSNNELVQAFDVKVWGEQAEEHAKRLCHDLNRHTPSNE